MKNPGRLAVLGLMLIASGCDIEENRDYGELSLQVSDAAFPLTPMTLTVQVNNDAPVTRSVNPATPATSAINLAGLSLDRINVITLSAPLYETWSTSFSFPSGITDLEQAVALERLQNSDLYGSTIRTFTMAGEEVLGLPLSVDGTVLPFTTPTRIELPPDTPVLLAASNGICNRGERVLSLSADDPGRTDTLWVTDQSLVVDTGAAGVQLLLDGQPVDTSDGALLNPAPGGFLSAYLPEHAFQPGASRHLTGMCDEPATFTWTPVTEGYQLGQLFPGFTLPLSIDGSDFSLSEYRGRVVMVNFWFINCVPCQAEMPVLQQILTEHHDAGFRILALDPIEPLTQQSTWVAANPQYTIDYLADLQVPLLAGAAGVQVFPKNFLLDRRGVIRMIVGQIEEESFTTLVEQLLAE